MKEKKLKSVALIIFQFLINLKISENAGVFYFNSLRILLILGKSR